MADTLTLGPIGLLPPSAAAQNMLMPEKDTGYQYVEGRHVSTEETMKVLARELLTRRNPTLHPGPMLIWGWTEDTKHKAKLALDVVAEVPGMNIITMPDYRPIYPKIDPEQVINPCHPNLTIQHNKIEVCVFIGVHCHFANITLKMIRANTNCYTMAWCAYDGHEDALLSIRDLSAQRLIQIKEALIQAKKEGVEPWALTPKGKQELEEIRERKEQLRAPEKDDASLFMHELESGFDENEE